MKINFLANIVATVTIGLAGFAAAAQETRPNVILILMDNLAYGELGSYGGGVMRGAATPRLDALAAEGLRLMNFNVEAQCTPSRAALMTGRYAIRSGNSTVAMGSGLPYGLTQWEYTMAEMFSDVGYRTAMYGKWHLGDREGRLPTDQGFDEWYGLPNSSNESYWPDNTRIPASIREVLKDPMVWQGRKGEKSEPVELFDLPMRARIDAEITDRAVAFIKREAKTEEPFFLFLPYTQTHQPRIPHADFDGKSGNGVWGDLLMQIDAYTGQVLDALEAQGIADDTIVIFTSDNGGDFFEDASFPGPWRGTYFTGLEGSLRVPFLMRWPGHIPAGSVSNEIVHEMDLLPTLAAIAGGTVPDDRIVDGVNQVDFITGVTANSPRESVIVYVGADLFAVKWHDWKIAFKEMDAGYGSPVKVFPAPVIYDLINDPREERPVSTVIQSNTWVGGPVMRALNAHLQSLVDEPPIPTGTTDPYMPGN